MIATIGFGAVAACLLLSALFVIRAANLVHAVLWLGVTLVGTAVVYAMLGASFLAAVQVLLYVGGVVTLMIFGVMLTRRHEGLSVPAGRTSRARGALLAAALFGVLAAALARSDLPDGPAPDVSTGELGASLLTAHVLAFELLSLLLLAAIIGAVVIARKRDPGAPPAAAPPRTGILVPAATVRPEESGTP